MTTVTRKSGKIDFTLRHGALVGWAVAGGNAARGLTHRVEFVPVFCDAHKFILFCVLQGRFENGRRIGRAFFERCVIPIFRDLNDSTTSW